MGGILLKRICFDVKIVIYEYFFFYKMIKYVDLMIRNVGYINLLSKDIYVNFLVVVFGIVEIVWFLEYFFGVGNFEG